MGGFHPLCYSVGIMILSEPHPRVILYRSPEPMLTPLIAGPKRRDKILSLLK